MKSIGLSNKVYQKLLNAKHGFEKTQGRVVSYDDTIDLLLEESKNMKKIGKNKRLDV